VCGTGLCEDRDGCEDLPLPLAHVGDKKVKRFHFSEIIGRLPYVRATVTTVEERRRKRKVSSREMYMVLTTEIAIQRI
jgi:hypothetical protein